MIPRFGRCFKLATQPGMLPGGLDQTLFSRPAETSLRAGDTVKLTGVLKRTITSGIIGRSRQKQENSKI